MIFSRRTENCLRFSHHPHTPQSQGGPVVIESAWHTHQSVCSLRSHKGSSKRNDRATVCLLLLILTGFSLLCKNLPSYLSFGSRRVFPSTMLTHRSQTHYPQSALTALTLSHLLLQEVLIQDAGHARRSHRPSDLPRLWGSPLSHSHRSPNTPIHSSSSSDSP